MVLGTSSAGSASGFRAAISCLIGSGTPPWGEKTIAPKGPGAVSRPPPAPGRDQLFDRLGPRAGREEAHRPEGRGVAPAPRRGRGLLDPRPALGADLGGGEGGEPPAAEPPPPAQPRGSAPAEPDVGRLLH